MTTVLRQILYATIVACIATTETNAAEPPLAKASESAKLLGPVELLDVIKPGAKPLTPGIYRLTREWVGTLSPLEDKLADTKLPPSPPENLRLNCISVGKNSMTLIAARFTNNGGISYSRSFKFSGKLHSAEEIIKTRELETLKSWYGKQHGWTDGWGDGETTNWSEHWMYFGLNPDGTITCQNIFAHASRRIGKRAKPFGEITPMPNMPSTVRIMNLMAGDFRPANPSSAEERRKFPSEEDKNTARLAAENRKYDALPEPLRSFIKERHTPDDHDLVAYKAAIRQFREKPDATLVHQLVERLDEGTCEIQSILDSLVDDGAHTLVPTPWNPVQKRAVIEALISALPSAPSYHAEAVIVMILSETGLVSLKMDEPGFSIDDAAHPRRPNTGGYGGSYMTLELKGNSARDAVLKQIGDELHRRWEAKGFPVERYSSPTPAE